MLKDLGRFSFWTMFLAMIVALILFSVTRNAFAQENIFGLLCFDEASAEEVATANSTGGFELENVVSEALVDGSKCVRLTRSEALQGFFVYEGRIIGQKQVIGMSPNPHGPPQMFGLMSISFNGRSA